MFDDLFRLIKSLYPDETPIPLHAPRFKETDKKYLSECIDSTFVSYVGPFVKTFEKQIAEYTGSKYAVAICNGTSALHLALVVSGVGSGDEVLLPDLTFVAAANAVTYTGAKCVFLDSETQTLGLCPGKLEHFLANETEVAANGTRINRRTKRRIAACVPVHIFGHSTQVAQIAQICERFAVALIEDATEALGTRSGQRHCGTFGKAGVLSFNGNKILTTGGGGMILTDDEEFARRSIHLSTTAKVPHAYQFIHNEIGYNYRMPNLNAAIGCAQMDRFSQTLENKRRTATKYRTFFENKDRRFVAESDGTSSNYWLNSVITANLQEKTELIESAAKEGIQMRPAWELMHRLPMYSDMQTGSTETAEWLVDRLVCLPSSVTVRN